MPMASVDVAVPCFQYGRFLPDSITSILNQNVQDLRILIIDNASTDDSVEVARELALQDSRIEVSVHQRNLGPNASYNEAIDWAVGDYFMILDADDVLAPGCLAPAMAIMEANPEIAFAYGSEAQTAVPTAYAPAKTSVPSNAGWNIVTGSKFIERTCRFPINTVATSSVLVRTTAQKNAGYFSAQLTHSDDLEMWLRLALKGSVASTKALHSIRRIHPSQITRSYEVEGRERDFIERLAAFDSFFDGAGLAMPRRQRLSAQAQRSLSAKAYWSALSHFYRGHYPDSRSLMKFALGRYPSMAIFPPLDWLLQAEAPLSRMLEIVAETKEFDCRSGRHLRSRT